MSFSAYLSFSKILCLFILLHYDLGLGLMFSFFFSSIYGMCGRFYLHKEAFVGDFVGYQFSCICIDTHSSSYLFEIDWWYIVDN